MATLVPSLLTRSSSFLTDIEDMHKCLNVFEFQQDLAADYGIICPWASERSTFNLVAILAPFFFIRSSSFLQVTRTTIRSRKSLNFSQIRSRTVELAALECLEKFPIELNWESCGHPSTLFGFDLLHSCR